MFGERHPARVVAVSDAWGAFKRRLAAEVPDLLAYGQIKAPATEILMIAAECWSRSASAAETADIPRS
jgi:hypothetical protein